MGEGPVPDSMRAPEAPGDASASPSVEPAKEPDVVEAPVEEVVEVAKTDGDYLDMLMKQCEESACLLKRGPDYATPAIDEIHACISKIKAERGA